MAVIDMTDKGPYYPKEQELDSSVPLITDLYEGMVDLYNTLTNNTDQISVGLTLTLLNFYF
ncbi:MAG: hypothetical protein GQ477_01720 [Nanohaloarchaea archaeon]|nr:hypothetical protein [Candidatus Nanohaloarchaea archaeon]